MERLALPVGPEQIRAADRQVALPLYDEVCGVGAGAMTMGNVAILNFSNFFAPPGRESSTTSVCGEAGRHPSPSAAPRWSGRRWRHAGGGVRHETSFRLGDLRMARR